MARNLKLQPAVDFLASYGLVLITITVALIAVGALALQQPQTPSCIAPPGFNCNFIAISTNGVLTAKMSQALGTQVTINGVGCANQQNYTYDTPLYGNVNVNSMTTFYPAPLSAVGHYPPGNIFYSGSYYVFYVYCYTQGANIAKGSIGRQFRGFLWLNYTIDNYGSQTQKIATFTAEYS
ncbi:MAG: hypothetical protein ACYCO0_00680 [Candidatus Micrarchaeaceae archaeon]